MKLGGTIVDHLLKQKELDRREKLRKEKPLVYEKVIKFDEKVARGESIAILQVQYNYACNFRCNHCSVKNMQIHHGSALRKLTPSDIADLCKQADDLGLARFEINGGEPLINTDLEELVTAINPEKFYINLVTNGWFLDDKKAEYLKRIGIDRIQVGIDSLDAEEHDEFRNKIGSHKKAINAVDACIKAGLDVFVTTVVTKQRLYTNEFMDFVKFFNEKGVGVFITYAKPVGAWEGNFDAMVNEEDLAYARELEKTHNVFSHLTSAYNIPSRCLAVCGLVGITQYGDVMPCQYLFIKLGNIFEEPLKDILERGMKLKPFHTHTCPIAADKDFVNNYIVPNVYGKTLPVPYQEVFNKEDME